MLIASHLQDPHTGKPTPPATSTAHESRQPPPPPSTLQPRGPVASQADTTRAPPGPQALHHHSDASECGLSANAHAEPRPGGMI
ncbi:unnamed protein product [Boreogadus saida]